MERRYLLIGAVGMVLTFCVAIPAFTDSDSDATTSIVTDENALFGAASDDPDDAAERGAGTGGDESGGSDLETSLFGGDNESDVDSGGDSGGLFTGGLIEEVNATSAIESNLLSTAGVEIGGRYSFSGSSSWTWTDPAALFENLIPDFDVVTAEEWRGLIAPDLEVFSIDFGTTLFFDARPDEDFRVFGKATVSYPFDSEGGAREFDEVISIEELFSDFNWNEALFFRGGKHTINWGVGYFFSPADLLNVTEIDPENPEADREGPLSLKTHFPFDAHNLYLYLIANDALAGDDNLLTWNEIGVAVKGEFVLGSTELGIGGLYQKDVAPSAMFTFSAPLWDVDLFGEAVLRYGSDKTFVVESAADSYPDDLFFHATAGFIVLYSFEAFDSSLNLAGQYSYNGEGYDDPDILKNPIVVGPLLESGALAVSDLLNSGKHYAAVSAGWNSLFGSDISLQLFWIHNFSDMSGYLSPTVSISFLDAFSLSMQTPIAYGDAGDEYSPTGESFTIRLAVGIGGGSF